MGIDYGPSHQGIEDVYVGEGQVLARLSLPSCVADTQDQYILHPSLMDSALQASIGLTLTSGGLKQLSSIQVSPHLPFALEELEICRPCASSMWALIRYTNGGSPDDNVKKLDLDLYDEHRNVCLRMKGFSSRVLEMEAAPAEFSMLRTYDKEIGQLHPLLHKNTSTAGETKFTSIFTGAEFFLADHIIHGVKVLPGVAYLEMARAAGNFMSKRKVLALKNIVWAQPIQVWEEPKEVSVHLFPKYNHYIYQIKTSHETFAHCQGRLDLEGEQGIVRRPSSLDIQGIESRCSFSKEPKEITMLLEQGFGIASADSGGRSFQVIQYLQYNDREALAELRFPACVEGGSENYVLHPSMMNGAFAAVQLHYMLQSKEIAARLPFTLEELWIYGGLPEFAYVYVRPSEGLGFQTGVKKYDIDLTDNNGKVVISFKGYTTISMEPPSKKNIVYATPQWQTQALFKEIKPSQTADPIFVLEEGALTLQKSLSKQWPGAHIEVLQTSDEDVAEQIQINFLQVFKSIHTCIQKKPKTPQSLIILIPENQKSYRHAIFTGLLKTARLESSKVAGKIIVYDCEEKRLPKGFLAGLEAEVKDIKGEVEIRYDREGNREVKRFKEIDLSPSAMDLPMPVSGDVVWITGGWVVWGRYSRSFLVLRKV